MHLLTLFGSVLKNSISLTFLAIMLSLTTFMIRGNTFAYSNKVIIPIQDDVYQDYQTFIGNRDVLAVNEFSSKYTRRDVIDIIIAQQALSLGGFHAEFHLLPGKVNFRNIQLLQAGELLLSFDTYWHTDAKTIADKLYISEPVIRNGEYFAGIYTSPTNHKVLQLKSFSDFNTLTAVSTPKWRTDWQTLQDLSLKELLREDSWVSMARMTSLQWVDFMLMPFTSTTDQSYRLESIHLIPVPNTAILLKGSRHFAISKAHPQGKSAFTAINKGLKILRSSGTIVRAYTEAGFFIDADKYRIINQ